MDISELDPGQLRAVLLFGPPGAGKGTQGKIIRNIPGYYHLASGEIFRTLDMHSPVGRIFYEYSSRGELVPDDTTLNMWNEHMMGQIALGAYKPHLDLLVCDGIPRTVEQAKLLRERITVDKILHLVCHDEDQMKMRIRRRALKENRFDDAREDVIQRRWEVYKNETQPVLDHYKGDVDIAHIDAMRSPAEVLQQILDVLIPVQNAIFRRGTTN